MPQLSLRSYGTEIACHAHDFNQIVLPRRGRLAMDIAGRGGAVSLSAGAFITAGTAHQYQAGVGDEFFVLDLVSEDGVTDDVAVDGFRAAPFFTLTAAQRDLLSYLDRVSPAAMAEDVAASRWQRLGMSWGLLMLDSLVASKTQERNGPLPIALRRALELMQGSFQERLSIAAIGRAAGLSETRLFRLFRQHLGVTPHAYLADLRLAAAERLLAGSQLPIAEIAWRSGHGDQATLTRQMQRRRGVTPAAYRRSQRQ